MQVFKLIIVFVIALLLAGILVTIGADYQLQVEKLVAGYDRMNIDLSLDGGATYNVRIASGVPIEFGINKYNYSLPNNPSLLTDNARVRYQTLRDRGATNGLGTAWSTDVFTVAGVYIITPAAGTVHDHTIPIKWISNDAGAQVKIAISTNAGASYALVAFADNVDGTNNYNVVVPDAISGRVKLTVASMLFAQCHGESGFFEIQ